MEPLASLLNNRSSGYFLIYSLLGALYTIAVGFLISRLGIVGAVLAIILPIAITIVFWMLKEPRFALLVYVQLCFIVGFSRFVPSALPTGLLVDGVLFITLFSLFLNGKRMEWHRLRSPVFALLGIWFLYCIIELFNPEAPYRPAWFFHVRPFSMHWIQVACMVLVVPLKRSDIRIFVNTWLTWSFLAALWAFKQQYIGLTANEQMWLDMGNASTHVLFGQLRSFSFYSDAAQFGAEMAGATLVSIIWVFEEQSLKRKLFFAALAMIYFWGYAVSGTRSALFVIIAGFPFYLLLKRDFMKLVIGVILATPLVLLLMYTSVGSSNYQVQRMRSALTPMNDPSFILRLQNQAKMRTYLRDLPFGAGIGTTTDGGTRFSPWHWAAQIAPDSWYVQLWMETGRVGLTLYILILIGIVGISIYRVWQLKDPWLVKVMFGFLAEFVGLAFMGYSNPVLGQFPTNCVIFISTMLVASSYRWDTKPAKPELTTDNYSYATSDPYEAV